MKPLRKCFLPIITCFLIISSPALLLAFDVAPERIVRPADNGKISGKVLDKATGKPIPGAVVGIPDLKNGTISDINGTYVLYNLPKKGTYLVQAHLVGYSTLNKAVNVATATTINFELNPATIESGEVVVTGVSRATEVKKSPIPIVAVTKTYLDQRAAAGNVIDEVTLVPGVSAVTTGPNVSKPFIHGLGYNRVITLEDGIRQEGQQWGDEHGIEVDQNSIDRIEIIKGPASLSYGSDAIAGVVNLLTPPPVADGTLQGSVLSTYGTNQDLLNGSFRFYGNQNGFVWGTILSSKTAKDYQNQHDGRVYNTGYKESDARVVVGLNKAWGSSYLNASLFDDLQEIPNGLRDSLTRKFVYQTNDNAVPGYAIVPPSVLNAYSISTLHQHVQLYRIYDNSTIVLGRGNLDVNLGYQFSHRREFTHPTQPLTPGLNLNLNTYTYDAKYNFNIGADYEASIGINGSYQNNTLGESTAFPIPTYRQNDFGPFAIVKKSFKKLDVIVGARFDTRRLRTQAAYIDTTQASTGFAVLYAGPNPGSSPHVVPQFSPLEKAFSGFTGSAGATYNISNVFLIKANMARGFRGPSIAEISANGPDPGSQIYHKGNSNFKPEFSLQEDAGVFLNIPKVSASIEVFSNTITHYIYQRELLNPDGTPTITQGYQTFTYQQDKARISGGESNLDIHPIPWLHFANSISLTYGKNLNTTADSLKNLPFIPPVHTYSELKANFNRAFSHFTNLYIFAGFTHFGAQNRFFSAYNTETYTAGYNLISAGFGGKWVNKGGRSLLELFVEGKNLANVNYQSNLSRLKYFDNANVPSGIQPGIFNMGRSVSFKLVLPFYVTTHTKAGGASTGR